MATGKNFREINKNFVKSQIYLLFQLNGVSTKEMTAATSLILAEHVEKTGNF